MQRQSVVVLATAGGLASLHTAHLASLEDGLGRVLDVSLRGDTDHELRNVHHLLADGNVLLADEHTGVMDGGSELSLDDEGLEAALQELGNGQTQDIIEFSLRFLEETETDHTADESLTCTKIKL